MDKNMTALISLFARDYHFINSREWIFKDAMAGELLTDDERLSISVNMSNGISFFYPGFNGSSEEALRFIVDHQLAPSVLARSVFAEDALKTAVSIGCKQYVIFASGYDSFSLRNPYSDLCVYELDLPEMIADKKKRISLNKSEKMNSAVYVACDLSEDSWKKLLLDTGFDKSVASFGSLLGISYYLDKDNFEKLIGTISDVFVEGSSICFDYPTIKGSEESRKNRKLAEAANQEMKAEYRYREIENILEKHGFLIYENLDDKCMAERFFKVYNQLNQENKMYPPGGVNYCLAVKK